MNVAYKSLCMETAIFTLTEIYFLSQSLLKEKDDPAAFLKKAKAIDVGSNESSCC